jgi:excisionase family DNA binding protein
VPHFYTAEKNLMLLTKESSAGIGRPYLTKTQIAKRYRVCSKTISNWIKDGLPVLRIGSRCLRFRRDEVERYMTEKFGTSGRES